MSDYYGEYFEKPGAREALMQWAETYLRGGCKASVVICAPARTLVVSLSEPSLSVADRLGILSRGIDALTSHRPDATHTARKFGEGQ
jgi:hypothetical protein